VEHGQRHHAPGGVRLRHCQHHVLPDDSDAGRRARDGSLSGRRQEVAVEEVRVREQEVRRRLEHVPWPLGKRRDRQNSGRGRLVFLLLLFCLLFRGRVVPPAPLLLVRDAARHGLAVAHLAEVQPDSAGRERVGLGRAAVLLEGGSEAADERVEAAPRLPERARARRRRRGVAEEGALRRGHLGLAELVQVAQELQHVRAAAAGQLQRRPVVAQVLPERLPVPALLRLVPARTRRCRNHGSGSVLRRRGQENGHLHRTVAWGDAALAAAPATSPCRAKLLVQRFV
jgi:hypothetical protein